MRVSVGSCSFWNAAFSSFQCLLTMLDTPWLTDTSFLSVCSSVRQPSFPRVSKCLLSYQMQGPLSQFDFTITWSIFTKIQFLNIRMHFKYMHECGDKNSPISFGRSTVLIRGPLAVEGKPLHSHSPTLAELAKHPGNTEMLYFFWPDHFLFYKTFSPWTIFSLSIFPSSQSSIWKISIVCSFLPKGLPHNSLFTAECHASYTRGSKLILNIRQEKTGSYYCQSTC